MISPNDLKPDMTVQQDGEIFVVLEQSQNRTARSAMVVRAKVRNLRTGSSIELSWGGGDKITPARIERREMQYLHDTDDVLVFMNSETYGQIEIPKGRLKWGMDSMKPNDNVNISTFESEIFSVILPDKVALRTVECELAVRGDIATPASENATLGSGLEIRVPLFINQDGMVLANTSDEKYSGRAED